MNQRPGLSRVEVVIVLLMVIVLFWLLMPATVHFRVVANQRDCANNLKQLGLGIHNYHDMHGTLPPLADQGPRALTRQGLPSMFGILMPYMEGTNLFFRPKRSVAHYHAPSTVGIPDMNKKSSDLLFGGVANQRGRLFLDPGDETADGLRDVSMTLPDGTTGYYATGSYAANGLLPWATGSIPESFARGTENTILIGERPQVCRTAAGDTVYNLWGVGFYSPHMPAFACLTPTDPPGLWSTGQIAPAKPSEHGKLKVHIGRRDAAPQPADFSTPLQVLRGNQPCDPRLPASPHLAGMQVLMGDGRVRLFAPDTSPPVFWAACAPGKLE